VKVKGKTGGIAILIWKYKSETGGIAILNYMESNEICKITPHTLKLFGAVKGIPWEDLVGDIHQG
jgi:hypothetical protein